MQRIGKYEVIRELGKGAMGKVYEARHPIMGTIVAIKVIHTPEFMDVGELEAKRKRLFDEARRAGALSHPNIVTIHDVDLVDDIAFIVMEMIRGNTLEDRLEPGKPMPTATAIDFLKQMASALDCAHARGIVHRDVKPANIMIAEGNRVKVADFGIAKDLTEQGATKTGFVLGTPYYMSPEQIQGLTLSGRSDQFALGVIAYWMLTGQRAFDGESVTSIMYKIVHGQVTPALELNRELNPSVAQALEQALAKEANQRFATCCEFISALEAALSRPAGLPLPLPAPVPFTATTVMAAGSGTAQATAAAPARTAQATVGTIPIAPSAATSEFEPPPAPGRNPMLVYGGAAAAVAVLGAAAWAFIGRTPETKLQEPVPVVTQSPVQQTTPGREAAATPTNKAVGNKSLNTREARRQQRLAEVKLKAGAAKRDAEPEDQVPENLAPIGRKGGEAAAVQQPPPAPEKPVEKSPEKRVVGDPGIEIGIIDSGSSGAKIKRPVERKY